MVKTSTTVYPIAAFSSAGRWNITRRWGTEMRCGWTLTKTPSPVRQWSANAGNLCGPSHSLSRAGAGGTIWPPASRPCPEQVVLTNGVDEAIHVLFETFLESGDELLLPVPTYTMYEVYSSATDARASLFRQRTI